MTAKQKNDFNNQTRRRSKIAVIAEGFRRSVVVVEEQLHSNFMSTLALCISTLHMFYLLMSVFPYSGFMTMNLIPTLTRETVGFHAGILTSSFMVGRAITSFVWGKVADVYGRKFVLLFSLWTSVIFALLFGMSPTFTWALVTRFLMGLGNGTMVIARTSISELSHGNRSTEAKNMGLLMSMVGYGMLLGPALGGTLSEPLQQYPQLAERLGGVNGDRGSYLLYVLTQFPFILPNLVASIFGVLTIIFVTLCVEETLPVEKRRSVYHVFPDFLTWFFHLPITLWKGCCKGNILTEKTGVRRRFSQAEVDEFMILDLSDNTELSALLSSSSSRRSYHAAMKRPSLLPQLVRKQIKEDATIYSMLSVKLIRDHLVAYWVCSFSSVAASEAFPLFAMAHIGGLGLSESEIGAIGTASGVIFCIFQYIIFASMTERLGVHKAMVYGCLLGNAPIILYPSALLLPKWAALWFLSFLIGSLSLFNTIFYAGITVANNRAVPTTDRAKLNGLASLGASISRATAPIVAGILVQFSFSSYLFPAKWGSLFAYLVLTSIAMSSYMLTSNLPEEVFPEEETTKLNHNEMETAAVEDNSD